MEIDGRKFNNLKHEIALCIHAQEKLFDGGLRFNDDVVASDINKAKEIVIQRYQNEVIFNRLVNLFTDSVVRTLDIRVN